MIPALISYILLNIFLARARAKSGSEVDEGRKAEIIAKVERIVDTIDRVVIVWFKFLLGLAIALALLLCVVILGILFESAAINAINILEFGSIAQIVEQVGTTRAISTLAIAIIPLIGVPYLLLILFRKRKDNKTKR